MSDQTPTKYKSLLVFRSPGFQNQAEIDRVREEMKKIGFDGDCVFVDEDTHVDQLLIPVKG